jgi:hypothetical protein
MSFGSSEIAKAAFERPNLVPMLFLWICWRIYTAHKRRTAMRALKLGELMPDFVELVLQFSDCLATRNPF